MTERDKEKVWSYESRYPLVGLYCWAELESTKLPPWRVPFGSERFSTENLPDYSFQL